MVAYSLAVTKTSAAAAGLICQLRAGTGRDIRVSEIGVLLSTAAAATFGVVRPTAVGSGFTSSSVGAAEDPNSAAGVAVIDTAASTAPTNPGIYMRRAALPGAIGAGIVWPFPRGLVIPTGGAIALWQLSTAAVGYEVYFAYDE